MSLLENVVDNFGAIFQDNQDKFGREISTISGKERFLPVHRVPRSGLEGNIFNMCCNPGEILLAFQTVTISANLSLASFTDC